jgi:hypothetical protein
MEHKQRLYDKQMTEMLVSQATQIHLLQRQYGLKQDTNVIITNYKLIHSSCTNSISISHKC